MKWTETKDATPSCDTMCLVVRSCNKNYIEVLNWNNHHKVWDDYEADDYFCDKEGVLFWISFDDIPEIPKTEEK